MAFTEGANDLPVVGGVKFSGIAEGTPNTSLLWVPRSLAAGDGLAAKYVQAAGLYGWNGATADRLLVDAQKNLRVALYDAAGNPLLIADDAAFTVGTSRVLPIGALADETSPDSVDEGDVGIPRMTLNRILRVVPTGSAGADLMPAAAAQADNQALPTTTEVAALLRAQRSGGSTTDLLRTTPANSDMTAADRLLAGAAVNFGYDSTTGLPSLIGVARTVANGASGQRSLSVAPSLHNGTTYDPQKGNTEGTLLASAARTANTNTGIQTNHNARGIVLYLIVTANPGGAETLSINLYNASPSGNLGAQKASFATPAATNGTYRLTVYPGATYTPESATNDKHASLPLPRSYYVLIQHSASGSWTYSLEYALIV